MQTLPWLDPLLARRAKLLPPWQDVYAAALTDRRGPRRDQRVVTALARNRLERSLVSPDPIARSLANAALLRTVRDETPPSTAGAPVSAPTTVSIMVHGTRGFRGDWWRPPGEFHGYIRQGLRPDLYSDGKRFTWTGNLSAKDRKMAGAYLVEWEPKGLHAVFAHSYGGEVAARAIVAALPVQELVLLSSVVNGHVVAALSRCPLVIDVRLRFDPVLAIAGSAQRLPERDNVAVVLFRRWNLDHSATHSTKAWLSEGVLGRVNAWH
jgi:hypothetical protein